MTTFWVSAGLLAAAAVAFLVVPLWRVGRTSGRWSPTGLVTAVLTVPVAVLVYQQVTTYRDAEPELPPGVPQEMADRVEALAARLEDEPDDVEGWRMLGRSYMLLGRHARARRAFMEAWERSPTKDPALKLGLAESMIYTDRSSLGGEAGRLIDEVLSAEPRNQLALWYGGFVALQRGADDVAVSRWQTLLATNPPPELAAELRTQIAALTGSVPEPSAGAAAGAAEGPSIELDVRVAESVSLDGLPAQAALFIFARAPGGGPPVAVIRRSAAAVPGAFTLSDADTMLPGRSLADYEELTLVARISKSGQPAEQPGDYFGQTTYGASAEAEAVELVIDRVVE